MFGPFVNALLHTLLIGGVVGVFDENSPGYAPDDVWIPRAEKMNDDIETLMEGDRDSFPTFMLPHKVNATFKVPHDRRLIIGLSVPLGRLCPEGQGDMHVWRFEDQATRCTISLIYAAEGYSQQILKYNKAQQSLTFSWNPVRLTFGEKTVVVATANGDDVTMDLSCTFRYSSEPSARVYKLWITPGWFGRPCMTFLHVPSWTDAKPAETTDRYLYAFHTIPEDSEHHAHDDVWLPRAKKYLRDASTLLGEDSATDHISFSKYLLNENLNATFAVPEGEKLTLVFMPLEGRTCVGGIMKGGISRVTIHDATSDCNIYVAIMLEGGKEEIVDTGETSLIFSWNPLRLRFNDEEVIASNAEGRRKVQEMECEFEFENANGFDVYRLWFRRGYNIDGTECSNVMLVPSYIHVNVPFGRDEAKVRRQYHSEL